MYSSKVEDFGCIQHPVYKFIGASPDGIIILSNTGEDGCGCLQPNKIRKEGLANIYAEWKGEDAGYIFIFSSQLHSYYINNRASYIFFAN